MKQPSNLKRDHLKLNVPPLIHLHANKHLLQSALADRSLVSANKTAKSEMRSLIFFLTPNSPAPKCDLTENPGTDE